MKAGTNTGIRDSLVNLYTLQLVDNRIAELTRRYASLDRAESARADLQRTEEELTEVRAELTATHARRAEVDDERRAVAHKRQEFEDKLYSGTTTNPRELQTLQMETEALMRQETRLKQAIEQLDGQSEAKDELETELVEKTARARQTLADRIAAFNAAQKQVQSEAARLKAERARSAGSIAGALLERYESIRAHRDGIAVVPLVDMSSCGGCRMRLPSTFVRQVRDGESIAICDNCGRIVVDAPPDSTD